MTPGNSAQVNESLTFVEGDTWGGVPGINILVNGTPPAADVASAKMQFRTTETSSDTILELSTAAAQITITSANNWTFVVPAQNIALPAGNYTWGFRTVDVGGVTLTYLEGAQIVLPKAVY